MTKTELEQVARHFRGIGLHSSWNELMVLADIVVGNLADAYKIVVRNSLDSNVVPSPARSNVYLTLQEKLFKAIASLTSEEMTARWESEVCGGDLKKMK